MREIGQTQKKLDVSLVPNGSILTIGLMDANDIRGSNFKDFELRHSNRSARAVSLSDGRFQVLEDTSWTHDDPEDYSLKPSLSGNPIATFGTGANESEFSPIIYKAAALNVIKNGKVSELHIQDRYEKEQISLAISCVFIDEHKIL